MKEAVRKAALNDLVIMQILLQQWHLSKMSLKGAFLSTCPSRGHIKYILWDHSGLDGGKVQIWMWLVRNMLGIKSQTQKSSRRKPEEDVTTTSGSAAGLTADSGMEVRWEAAVSWTGATCCWCCRAITGGTIVCLDCSTVHAWDAFCSCCWCWKRLCSSWCYIGIPHSQKWGRPSLSWLAALWQM